MDLTRSVKGVVLVTLTALAVLASLVVGAVKLEAKAEPSGASQVAKCWVGFGKPAMSGRTTVSGEVSFTCLDGYLAKGVPNINERIISMEIRATLRYLNPATGDWEDRGTEGYAVKERSGTLRLPLSAACTPTIHSSGLWQVHVIYAVAEESNPNLSGVPGINGDRPWEWYGESGRTVELPCV